VQGWRSVSVVCPPYGMVLYAAAGAPAFLRLVSGRLVRHEDTLDTRGARVKRGPARRKRRAAGMARTAVTSHSRRP